MALRKGKYKESSPKEQLEMLDPFVPILSDDILANSRHGKLLSKALKCLMMLLHLPLPSLKVRTKFVSKIQERAYGGLSPACTSAMSNFPLGTFACSANCRLKSFQFATTVVG